MLVQRDKLLELKTTTTAVRFRVRQQFGLEFHSIPERILTIIVFSMSFVVYREQIVFFFNNIFFILIIKFLVLVFIHPVATIKLRF